MKNNKPYKWVPSLYFAEALPYVAVMTISVTMYKKMGMSNTDLAIYTSWLYLPWVIKPLWSPFVDAVKTKRWWILAMQFLVGLGFAGIAFTIPASFWIQATLAFFWLIAFCSATHDIAADGFYILALDSHDQAMYVGIRSTFYRIATIFGQGALVMLAGWLELSSGFGSFWSGGNGVSGNIPFSWAATFLVMAILFLCMNLYHRFALPKVENVHASVKPDVRSQLGEFVRTLKIFFSKPQIVPALLFMLLFMLRGIPFVDIAYMRRCDLNGDILTYRRRKTGAWLTVRIEPEAMKIIEKLKSRNPSSPYLFPFVRTEGAEGYRQYTCALRRFNYRLKQMAVHIGENITLSSYTARHSWATLANYRNFQPELISNAMGHSSVKVTETYFKRHTDDRIHEMNKSILSYLFI